MDPKRQRIDALEPEKPVPRIVTRVPEELPYADQMAAMVSGGSKVRPTCAAKSTEAVEPCT